MSGVGLRNCGGTLRVQGAQTAGRGGKGKAMRVEGKPVKLMAGTGGRKKGLAGKGGGMPHDGFVKVLRVIWDLYDGMCRPFSLLGLDNRGDLVSDTRQRCQRFGSIWCQTPLTLIRRSSSALKYY